MANAKNNSTVVKSRHDNSKFGSGVKVTSEPVRFTNAEGCGCGCGSSKPVGCGSSNQVKIKK